MIYKAKDTQDNVIKTFSFDRILEVDLLREKFTKVTEKEIDDKFKNFFGVITPDEKEPEEIILQFKSFQGKYIESLPLHHSQKTVKKNDNILQISLFLVPTYDFIIELMSMRDNVEIIKPKSLQQTIKDIALKIADKY